MLLHFRDPGHVLMREELVRFILLGNFRVEYFESLELYPTTLELRSSLRSLGRF